jgi:pyrroline-5-carboxylate reductase
MKIGFIGCGNMGTALAKAVARTEEAELYLSDHDAEKRNALAESLGASAVDNATVASECEVVFLAVKPTVIESVCREISEILRPETVVVSMAAGVKLEKLSGYLPSAKIIRIMPNTPVLVGEGVITWAKNGKITENDEKIFTRVLSYAGIVDEVNEKLIDAATAVAGCGPAFVYLFAEALADAGVQCGLTRDKALLYAAATLRGAADMILETGKHPGQLKDEVCSPGGSTIVGVRALEEGGFRAIAGNAVVAAYEKTKRLGD